MADRLPSPGWYEDPWNACRPRWWDGTQWTENGRPAVQEENEPSFLTTALIGYHKAGLDRGVDHRSWWQMRRYLMPGGALVGLVAVASLFSLLSAEQPPTRLANRDATVQVSVPVAPEPIAVDTSPTRAATDEPLRGPTSTSTTVAPASSSSTVTTERVTTVAPSTTVAARRSTTSPPSTTVKKAKAPSTAAKGATSKPAAKPKASSSTTAAPTTKNTSTTTAGSAAESTSTTAANKPATSEPVVSQPTSTTAAPPTTAAQVSSTTAPQAAQESEGGTP